MSPSQACSVTLDGCGALILFLFLIPQLLHSADRRKNRRRQRLLNEAAICHLFALLLRSVGFLSALVLESPAVQEVYNAVFAGLWVLSVGFVVLCVCCDADGRLRVPRGRDIPLGQIASGALSITLAVCLHPLLPQVSFLGIAWAAALHLNHSLLLLDGEKRLTEAEQKLNRTHAAQLSVLMQPHFLFNTLTAIESLCLTDPQAAAECVENFSGYLRGNLDAMSAEALIPFDTEMEHIRQYIALEQAEPSRRFHFDYELDVRDFLLPALTVQPIVENAVKHGALTHRDGTGRVMLTTQQMGDYVCVTVTDNGVDHSGLTQAQRERQGIGIESTRKRLQILCGGSLQLSSDQSGTKAVILIPKKAGELS